MDYFDPRIKYRIGSHAIIRWKQRSAKYNLKKFDTIGNIIYYLNNAALLMEYKRLRVLRYQDLVFPCVKLGSENEFDYKLMTVLTWDMVQDRHQMLNGLYRPEIKSRNKIRRKRKKEQAKAGLE